MKGVFRVAVAACLVLSGWALWTGGILDNAAARQVRSTTFYAAPDVQVDRPAAERIIGNRRLTVLLYGPGEDLREACDDVRRAADGTLVLAMSVSGEGDGYETYGCSLLPGAGDENFGRAFVAETTVSRGVDQFPGRPLEALKAVVVNFDQLAKSGTVPSEARTITPSLPRYLIAGAAVLAVLLGSLGAWVAGRRVARLTARRSASREETDDEQAIVRAAAGVLARKVVELDGYALRLPPAQREKFESRYREWAVDCTEVLGQATSGDPAELTKKLDRLNERADRLVG